MAWYHPKQEEPLWEAVQFNETEDKDWTDFDKYEYKFN